MDREELFPSLKNQVLQTPAYRGVPSFPQEVERIQTLEQLVWWLGTTTFSAVPHAVALSHLSLLFSRLDPASTGLTRLLFFLTHRDPPGFFPGHERQHPDSPLLQRAGGYEASRANARAVRQVVKEEPRLRKALAQYLLFEEDLAGYETLMLAQLAERVEEAYRWEYGNDAFASSTRDVASALAYTETERESLHKMLTLALEIGTGHIRSRLAVNWLAQVKLRDPALQQALSRLKQMTLKQIWQQKMAYKSDDPEFITVLLRGGSFDGQHH